MALSCSVHIFTDDYFVLSQSTRLTDGQTDIDSRTVRMHSQSHSNTTPVRGIAIKWTQRTQRANKFVCSDTWPDFCITLHVMLIVGLQVGLYAMFSAYTHAVAPQWLHRTVLSRPTAWVLEAVLHSVHWLWRTVLQQNKVQQLTHSATVLA